MWWVIPLLCAISLLLASASQAESLDTAIISKVVSTTRSICLSGSPYDLQVNGDGSLSLLKLEPSNRGKIRITQHTGTGGALNYQDEGRRVEADENIIACITKNLPVLLTAAGARLAPTARQPIPQPARPVRPPAPPGNRSGNLEPPPPLRENPYYASRIFSGPTQYPPAEFAAYGIVAFPVRATKEDLQRYNMICEAYASSLLFYKEVPVPLDKQMVTVWPIDSDNEAKRANQRWWDDVCPDAVKHYGLLTAEEAILDARKDGARIDGLGPFLLAWSPAGQKGRADALVLVSDLSEVTTIEQAKSLFMQWSQDIEKNPELWDKGWNISKLKTIIRLWADKYGERLLQLAGVKS
jgi:hypothetical protein